MRGPHVAWVLSMAAIKGLCSVAIVLGLTMRVADDEERRFHKSPAESFAPALPATSALEVATASAPIMVFAHRGDSCCAPENTLVAIEQAFQKGADHVEIDVRPAKDGTLVLMHDDSVDRTTNGTGRTSELTVHELKRLDAGSWFASRFAGEHVPTLAEALRAVQGRGRLYLDIKGTGLAAQVRAAIEEAGVPRSSVWCWLHTPAELDDFSRQIPGVSVLYGSIGGYQDPAFFRELRAKGVEGFSIPYAEFTHAFATRAKAEGMIVDVFTLLSRDEMQSAIRAGVDAIQTDYPDVLLKLLSR